ncbi:MAG: TIGR01212 family radical SAM protein [Tissierellia bacterium]|nr:TIGR01212 family radical SAM protein [Tissierellia bacterium]
MNNNLEKKLYRSISDYYLDEYGEKVYKLPIHLPLTCPNRDGSKGKGGCIFCGSSGGSFETHGSHVPVREQLQRNRELIHRKYKANKFISYFMNYSNTYLPLQDFKFYISEALDDDIVGLNISTRPDMIFEDQLDFLSTLPLENRHITFELGLQTVNTTTLEILNRCHGLSDFIWAARILKNYGYRICTHFILDLPWDSNADVKEAAEICNVLQIDEVKIHSLYVLKNTLLGNKYVNGEFIPLTEKDYIERVALFLSHLHPDIVISRIVGRAPEEESLMVNWNKSWWKVRDALLDYMLQEKNYKKKGGKSYGKVHFR